MSWVSMGVLQIYLQALEILQVVARKVVPEKEARLSQSNKIEHPANRRRS